VARGKDAPLSKGQWMAPNAFEVLHKYYGQYAFGLASVLVIWLLIFQPMQKQARLEFEAQREITVQMQSISENMKSTAEILKNAADKMGK